MPTIVYKIVTREENGRLRSCIKATEAYKRDFEVEYCIGQVSYPHLKGSALFAFKTKQYAKDFIRNKLCPRLGNRHIFESTATRVRTKGFITHGCYRFAEFWKRSLLKRKATGSNPPEGTLFCSTITLLKEVT